MSIAVRSVVGIGVLAGACLDEPPEEQATDVLAATSTTVVSAEADAMVRSGSFAAKNYAGAATIYVDLDDSSTVEHGYLRFRVGAVGAIARAKLRLSVTNSSGNAADVRAVSNTTWSETAITWNSRPTVDGPLLGSIVSAPTGSWVEVDVTSVVAAGKATTFAVLPRSTDSMAFATRDHATVDRRPQLVIEPATGPDPDFGTCALVRDHVQRTKPSVPKPDYLQSYVDALYGTKITRITGNPGTAIPVVGGTWGNVARHHYSKDGPWNADMTLLSLSRVEGVSGYLFLDGSTYQPLFKRSGPGGDTRWHPKRADTIIYISSSCSFGHWNPRTDTKTVLLQPTGYTGCSFGPSEGNPSRDGRWVAAAATRSSDGKQVAFAVDLDAKTKRPDLDLAAAKVTDLDWISASSGGGYLVVNGTIDGFNDATRVFTLDGAPVGALWSTYGHPSHYDLTLDASGNEVAVGVAKSAPNNGKVIMRRLQDGVETAVSAGGYATHTSTRNYDRPGWAYVTHEADNPNYPPYRSEIFAVKLDDTLTINRLGSIYPNRTDYLAEVHGVPSPDGKRVLFSGNFGLSARPIQTYVIDLRDLCP